MTEQLSLAAIRTDAGTQPRAGTSGEVVDDYAALLAAKVKLPPVVVFHDGTAHYLADGYHRYEAHAKLGRPKIAADVRQGTLRDAILYSLGANQAHGLRRTNGDKRRAVIRLFQDEEWAEWSDGRIAEHCGVSQPFVGAVRKEMRPATTHNGYESSEPEKRIGRDGVARSTPRITRSRSTASDRDVTQEAPEDDEPVRQVDDEFTPSPAALPEPVIAVSASLAPTRGLHTADEPASNGLVTDPGEGGDIPDLLFIDEAGLADDLDLVEGSVFGNEPGTHTPEAVEIASESVMTAGKSGVADGLTAGKTASLETDQAAGAPEDETSDRDGASSSERAYGNGKSDDRRYQLDRRRRPPVDRGIGDHDDNAPLPSGGADFVTLTTAEHAALVKRAEAPPFLVAGHALSAIEYCASLLRDAVTKIAPEDAAEQFRAAMYADDVTKIVNWMIDFDVAFRERHGQGTEAALAAE